jgi:hypothetical protein
VNGPRTAVALTTCAAHHDYHAAQAVIDECTDLRSALVHFSAFTWTIIEAAGRALNEDPHRILERCAERAYRIADGLD